MSEERRLWDYLNRHLDERTGMRAWLLWVDLRGAPMPNAGALDRDHMIYTWDKGAHHFAIDIISDTPTEYFYLNRDTGATWEHP